MSDDARWLVGAVSAVVTVNIILGVFSYIAYCEEARNWADKQRLKEKSDQEFKDKIQARKEKEEKEAKETVQAAEGGDSKDSGSKEGELKKDK